MTHGKDERRSSGRPYRAAISLAAGLALTLALAYSGPGDASFLLRNFDDPTVTTMDRFGSAVALGAELAVVGAPGDSTLGDSVGQAHAFSLPGGGLLRTLEDPTVTFSDDFGAAVAIAGSQVLIGAPEHQGPAPSSLAGQAHLFDAVSGALLRTFDDPTPGTTGSLGWPVDSMGWSVALADGMALAGAPGDSTHGDLIGQAYLFDAATGDLLQIFDDPTPTLVDFFGWSVSMDGGRVLIGAPGHDAGFPGVGQAHLFDATTGALLWTFDDPTPHSDGRFGTSVALEGDLALIGGPGDATQGPDVGQAYLFDAATGALLRVLDDPTVTEEDLFGTSVALDGGRLLVGAPGDDTAGMNVGQAYLFDAATGSLLETFDDPTPTDRDVFGTSVALHGDRILIGASGDDTFGSGVGQAHLFLLDEDGDGLSDSSDPDTVANAVIDLADGVFDNNGDPEGQRNALLNRLEEIEDEILAGDVDQAIRDLESLRRRVDGCGAAPDMNDWIIDCPAQIRIRELIDDLIATLSL